MDLPTATLEVDRILENGFVPFRGPQGPYDDLGNQVDGIATRFVLTFAPVNPDPNSLTVLADDAPVPASGWAVVPATGELNLQNAPLLSLRARYQYQKIRDEVVAQAVVDGVNRLQQYGDITLVPDGLMPAVFHYAKANAYRALSARYAERIDIGIQGRNEAWAQISKQYLTLSETEFKDGDNYRDQYYKRAGARYAPAVGWQGFRQVRGNPPIR